MRPILLLDVDGVLLVQNQTKTSRLRVANIGHNSWFDPTHANRLAVLSEWFDIHWCTGWESMANSIISPLFGLGHLPVVPMRKPDGWIPRPFYTGQTGEDDHDAFMNQTMNWKLAAVEAYLEGNPAPVAWLDDQIGQDDVKLWARQRPSTLLQPTQEHVGLTGFEVKRLVRFAMWSSGQMPKTLLRTRVGQSDPVE